MSAVSFDKVSIRLAQRPILADVSFAIEPGEIVGILGPNGAGKTTLYNLLTGFIPFDSGSVVFKGRNLRGLAPYRIAGLGISRTFQLCRPFAGMTVFENVLVGGLGAHSRDRAGLEAHARALLGQVGLGGKEQLPVEGWAREIALSRVDLPAPFGPSTATNSPAPMLNETFSSATALP